MTAIASIAVAPSDWVAEASSLRARGLTLLDVLTVVDRGDERELVVCLMDPDSGHRALVTTRVSAADARIDSLVRVFAGASWHEREAAEMFGVAFDGHPDPRPLLLHGEVAAPPLLASTALPARLATAWPAAVAEDAGRRARRPQLPPGVRAEWVEERS